jgi:hypothetical protein
MRGVTMTIAVVHEHAQELEWLGVGNVDGVLVRGGVPRRVETVFQSAGVLGYRLPALLQTYRTPIRPGDVLVLTTDGIEPAYLDSLTLTEGPADAANRILAEFARPEDDALVLVAKYLGPTAAGRAR